MRAFYKSEKMDHVRYDIRGPVLDEADKLVQKGIPILKLNTGNPGIFDFNAPDEIIRGLVNHVHGAQAYSDSKGLLEARLAILNYSQKKGIPNLDIDHIFTGNGVSELILMAMQGFLNSGDEILIPSPDYPLWTASVTLAGGTPVHYICDEEAEWYPDIADMRRKITSRTKGIVIINPNNPTGALYPKEILEQIVSLAREHDLMIFADEIYDRMVMDGLNHISIASLAPDLTVVTLNGLSKSHKIAGFRCGWMCISGDTSKAKGYIEGINVLASMRLCSNVLSQYTIPVGLKNESSVDESLLPGGRIYEQREYITQVLNDIPGISAVKPKAAFYIFPKIDIKKFNIYDDERFVADFLREKHILLVHGRGFNWREPDHFRVVFLPKVEELAVVKERLSSFLENYSQLSKVGL